MSSSGSTDDDSPELSEVSFEELVQMHLELREEFKQYQKKAAEERGDLFKRVTRLEQERETLTALGDSKVDQTARIILENFDALSRPGKDGMMVSTKVDEHGVLGLTEFFTREVDGLDVDTTMIKKAMKCKIAGSMPMYEYRDEGKYEAKHLVRMDE